MPAEKRHHGQVRILLRPARGRHRPPRAARRAPSCATSTSRSTAAAASRQGVAHLPSLSADQLAARTRRGCWTPPPSRRSGPRRCARSVACTTRSEWRVLRRPGTCTAQWRASSPTRTVAMNVTAPAAPMDYFFEHHCATLVYFIHAGRWHARDHVRPHRVPQGDFLIIPKGIAHRFEPASGPQYYWMYE